MKLYLIRHTSVAVPAGFAYGQTDIPLKETFEIEASTVKQRLEGINIERVWTSPLSRCTREPLYPVGGLLRISRRDP